MNKILMLLLLIVAIPFAFADDSTLNDTIVNETAIMHSPYGAEVRLLQLEEAVDRAIAQGQEVIVKIQDSNYSVNTTELESLLMQLEALKSQISSVNSSAENAVEEYLGLRQDANGIVKQFRELARELAKDKAEQIREEIKERNQSIREEIKSKLEQARCRYNAERAGVLLGAFNVSNSSLLEELASCDAEWSDVREELESRYEMSSEEDKNEVRLMLKENLAELRIRAISESENREDDLDHQFARAQERLERMNNSELRERAKDELERIREQAKERREQMKELQNSSDEDSKEDREDDSEDSDNNSDDDLDDDSEEGQEKESEDESDDDSGNGSRRGED